MWKQHRVNVAFSPSRTAVQNTTAAQLLRMETLHGAQLSSPMTPPVPNGEIVVKVSAHDLY